MYMNHYDAGPFINMPFFALPFLGLIVIAALWSVTWKGLGLWHSAQRGQHWWFIILMFINTLGILEIIYLFFVAKLSFNELFTSHTSHREHAHSHSHEHDHHTHNHN